MILEIQAKKIITGECAKDFTTHMVAPKILAAAGVMISPGSL